MQIDYNLIAETCRKETQRQGRFCFRNVSVKVASKTKTTTTTTTPFYRRATTDSF